METSLDGVLLDDGRKGYIGRVSLDSVILNNSACFITYRNVIFSHRIMITAITILLRTGMVVVVFMVFINGFHAIHYQFTNYGSSSSKLDYKGM